MYGSIAVGAYHAHQPGTHQAGFKDQYRPAWDRGGARGLTTRADPMAWRSKWSFGCRVGYGSPSGADGAVWLDLGQGDWYNPAAIQDGSQSIKWILGQCLDASSNPAAGAVVQCFRTSDDLFTGEVNAGGVDGTFAVPTPYAGVNHYLVAYKPGSPDIGGTTVNTLTPTNVDGT